MTKRKGGILYIEEVASVTSVAVSCLHLPLKIAGIFGTSNKSFEFVRFMETTLHICTPHFLTRRAKTAGLKGGLSPRLSVSTLKKKPKLHVRITHYALRIARGTLCHYVSHQSCYATIFRLCEDPCLPKGPMDQGNTECWSPRQVGIATEPARWSRARSSRPGV